MMSEMKVMWSCKYALSEGVEEIEVCVKPESGYAYTRPYWRGYKIGQDIFATKQEALQAAQALRDKKINSLKKQISKLENLTFI